MFALDAATPERIRAAAADVLERYRVPGISIGVVQAGSGKPGDEVVFCEGFGYADIESAEPMNPERRQRIASITKTMVGLCVMSLVEDGKLTLSSPIVDLLPDVAFNGPSEAITLRHLLTHTSGIGEAPTLERLRDVANPDRAGIEQPGDFTTLYPNGVTVEVEPGTKWAYCNNGYGLLGEIVERAAGTSLQEAMDQRIWRPLGMTSTDILDENDDRITTCYHRGPSDDTRFQLDRAGIPVKEEPTVDGLNIRGKFTADFNKGMRAAGGVQSTVPDMLKYASALLRRGAGIVKPETYDAMVAAQHGSDPRMVRWGLSFALSPLRITGMAPAKWPTLIGHGGAYFGGWNSHIDVLPEARIGIVQHMNIMLDEPAPVFRSIIRAVLGLEDAPLPALKTDLGVRASAPGIYELPMPGPLTNFRPQTRVGRVNIEQDGDGLTLQSRWGKWKDRVALTPADPDDPGFFAIQTPGADPAFIAMDRDVAGRVTGLRMDDLVQMHRRAD
jgi:CubicO group peptidase (beta-lactamase class C family)